MKNPNTQAFTLLELMIVMTIMVITSLMVYTPYQHYQTKQKLRNSAKIISQTLYNARNLAINGVETASGNLAIGVYFGSGSKSITLYGYPFGEYNSGNILDFRDTDIYEYKRINLEPGVELVGVEEKSNGLFLFEAISGSGSYYYYDGMSGGMKNSFSGSELDVKIGFKGVKKGHLSTMISYYTQTYVSDIQ